MLETERLLLRAFTEQDLDAYAAMLADPEVIRFLSPAGAPLRRPDAWRQIALILGHWQLRGFGFFAVEEKQTGRFVGRVGHWQPEGWPGFEVGWAIAREFWGMSYAYEAATACLEHAFGPMDRPAIVSSIHPENIRSIRLAERLGGTYRRDAEVLGMTVRVYGIDRDRWRALHPAR